MAPGLLIYCDACVWADRGAQRAAGAVVVRVIENNRPVALAVQFLREFEDVFGTGVATKFAALAPFDVNKNPTLCHSV
jgi:hypothetical protein